MKKRKSKSTQTIIKTNSKSNIKKIRKKSKSFENFPIEIIEQIFLQIINHQCKRGHKWCFNENDKHRYDRNKIHFLTEVCKSWANYIYPYIWKSIELNRNLSLKEQWRTTKLMILLNNKRSIAKNYINEIYINYNFITNGIISNIVENSNINININGYILNKNTFNKEILINFYKNSNDICICCKKEPVYWNSKRYLSFCLNCLYYKYKITLSLSYMNIIEELNFLENNIFVDNLKSFLNSETF